MTDESPTPRLADTRSGQASGGEHTRDGAVTFVGFVLSLAHTAAVHFGDVANPATGESEPNLDAARQMIEILSLLEEKTRGNLTAEERQLLDQILYELRLRYVEADKPVSRIITP
jgi:hypothetical protein